MEMYACHTTERKNGLRGALAGSIGIFGNGLRARTDPRTESSP